MEERGSLEVGLLGKVSLLEKVVLLFLAIEAGTVKEGFGFLSSRELSVVPSSSVPSRRVQVLEASRRRINL